ncbi:MAG: formate dehydrogenase accessory sulfurtransferase FdhD [Marinobacter sp.]|uniref:formate dehydrogenase accessory sulfurtransferase FdhD n=1 Tax=Marinobacter sp. TaxID=50741 RepID=UPI00299EFE0B|nr:formate dehydrogenase accessory sulfurtransferase FdhD [Marinobacter sp.]MDX1755511.1 formate dehydrogenase accessory sulfurtransferase FdhD [Marinobacter sp.]
MASSGNEKTYRLKFNDSPASPEVIDYLSLGPGAMAGESALADEIALALSYNGIGHAVMMMSPGNLEDFVLGFSLTNNIVSFPDEIHDIRVSGIGDTRVAEIDISNRAFWALKQSRRQLAGTSGCGMCGVEAMEQALPLLSELEPAPVPRSGLFRNLRSRICVAQQAARLSGALHAALYFDDRGTVRLCREDIGRHNALDKLIGGLSTSSLDLRQGFVVVTSRCSLELVQKAVRARIGTLASLSAPTALAVKWARKYRLNLVHVPHRSAPRVYSPVQKAADS